MRRALRPVVLALCVLIGYGVAGCEPADRREPEPTGNGSAGRMSQPPPELPPRDPGTSATDAGAQTQDAGAASCAPPGDCDLFAVDGCGPGSTCVLLQQAGDDAADAGTDPLADEDAGSAGSGPTCIAAGAGRDGDACDGPGDCGPGLDCSAEQAGTCRRYCCALNTTAGLGVHYAPHPCPFHILISENLASCQNCLR